MNLSPIKYAKVVSKIRGPIDRTEGGNLEIDGQRYFVVNAWLSRKLNLKKEFRQIFSAASGSGMDKHAIVAHYKAISEALERWAYYYLTQIGHTRAYGFDLDASTTGMAAFPGLWSGQARRLAHMEAEERYCVQQWWNGNLASETESRGGYQLLKIQNPISSTKVVLTWKQYSNGRYAYGTAAGKTWQAACESARLEMEGSAAALRNFGPFDSDSMRQTTNYGERQILYYSLPQGHAEFLRHLEQRPARFKSLRAEKVIDCIIPGPWQKYATVWRVLYVSASRDQTGEQRADFLY